MTEDFQPAKRKMSLLIKQQTSPEKYHRGFEYYQNHKISNISQRGCVVSARAHGKTEDYRVSIDLDSYYGQCSCPSDSFEEKCKHVAALAFALVDENYDDTDHRKKKTQQPKLTVVKAEPKKPKKAVKAKLEVTYPPLLRDFLAGATAQDQADLLHKLLANDKKLHKMCVMLLQSQSFDRKVLEKLLKKHVKTVENDFYGHKANASLKTIQEYLNQLQTSLFDDKNGYEQSLEIALLIKIIILDQWSDSDFYQLYCGFVDPVVEAFDQDPKEYQAIIENMLVHEEGEHLLWQRLIQWNGENTRSFIYDQIEASNLKNSPYFLSSENCQKDTLMYLIQSLPQEDEYFHRIIEECDYIKDKDEYYRHYYQTRNPHRYLEYTDSLYGIYADKSEIEFLVAFERWDKLDLIVNRLMNDRQYASLSSREINQLYVFQLKVKIIHATMKKPQEALQSLYQLLADNQEIAAKDKAQFFWEEKEYMALIGYFRWFREKSLKGQGYYFKPKEHREILCRYLSYLVQIDHKDVSPLFIALLENEKYYLKNTQSNIYDFTYEVVQFCYGRGLMQATNAFVQYCAKHFPNRKKLNEVLGEIAEQVRIYQGQE